MTMCEMYPATWQEFIEEKYFRDHKEIYTNGSEIMLVSDVKKMMQHYSQERPKGRWIELPCEVGDTVYIVGEHFPAEIEEIRITPRGIFFEYAQYDRGYELTELWNEGSFCPEDIGKAVFLTIEERNVAEDACGDDIRQVNRNE